MKIIWHTFQNPNMEFPDISLTFAPFQNFPDIFSNSLTIPWPWKNKIFPDFSLTCGNPANVSRLTWNYMHRYSWKELIETCTFLSDWWKYWAKSCFGSTSSSCSSSYSIHWSSRLCTVLLITGVSAFMLLMMSLWHLIEFRYLSRYVLYRDLCIEIRIVSWGTCIVIPLTITWLRYKYMLWGIDNYPEFLQLFFLKHTFSWPGGNKISVARMPKRQHGN